MLSHVDVCRVQLEASSGTILQSAAELRHNERVHGIVHQQHFTAHAMPTTLGSTGKCQTPDWVSRLTKACITLIAYSVSS